MILHKRIIAVFTLFCIAIGCLCLRLYSIASSPAKYVSQSNSHYENFELQEIRGKIVDCNGIDLVDTEYDNYAVAKPTLKALASLEKVLDVQKFSDIKERMGKSNAVYVNLKNNYAQQNSDIINIKVYKRNSEYQSAQHILGYVKSDGNGANGIEYSFNDILKTDKYLTARIMRDAYGRAINGCTIETVNDNLPTAAVKLTIDSKIQKITENALDLYKIKQGGAVVIDIKSGAIRASVSRPDYNSNNISTALNDEASPLLNRALQAYSVGSVFKVAVCIASMNCGITDYEYQCNGSCKIDGINFNCNNSKAHGKLDMQKALECSCNCYFINLAKKIGAKAVLETANAIGFGVENKLADGIFSKSGVLPSLDKLASSGELANFSFGQGKFTASMLQIAQMIMCVANSGEYLKPYLVESVTDKNGNTVQSHKSSYPTAVTQSSYAKRLSEMLKSVVENGNAKKAKPSSVTAAGKTATAQTGTFYSNGVEICNTWFAGYFPAENPEYAVIILKQGGFSGATDNAPVFRMIADAVSKK